MEQLRSAIVTMIVCCSLCGMLLSCNRSNPQVPPAETIRRANNALSSRGLPVLPNSATDVHYRIGGSFSKYMNVKFTASADQALDYLHRIGASCYIEFVIEGDQYRILATHPLASASASISNPRLYCIAEHIGIRCEPWFRSVYDIRHGWYYHYVPRVAEKYTIYYDVDNQQLYIYWTYS